jgi:CRISPR system Cascade subunit CasB
MHRYIVPWTSGLRRWDEDACYIVASLFASHPQPGGDGNLGDSLAQVAQQERAQRGLAEVPESLERRFAVLLNCVRREDLPGHLRQAVSLLKAHEVPVNWRQLLRDYRDWEREDRRVQRAWARAFWGTPRASTAATPKAKNMEEVEEVTNES